MLLYSILEQHVLKLVWFLASISYTLNKILLKKVELLKIELLKIFERLSLDKWLTFSMVVVVGVHFTVLSRLCKCTLSPLTKIMWGKVINSTPSFPLFLLCQDWESIKEGYAERESLKIEGLLHFSWQIYHLGVGW